MILIVGDEDGNILGSKDITDTRWRLLKDHLVNMTDIIVPIHAAGTVRRIGFVEESGRLYNTIGEFYKVAGHTLGKQDTLCMRAGMLEWYPVQVGMVERDKLTNQMLLKNDVPPRDPKLVTVVT